MKTYAIYDEDWKMKCPIGYLYYYDKCNEFIIELNRELDKWEAPLLFSSYVEKSIYTIPKEVSMLWVRERVIPSGRQNIGSILKNHKMKSYDEMKLLELSGGRCSQDNCYIKKVEYEDVPLAIRKRSEDNVLECFTSGESDVICLFGDDTVRRIDLTKLVEANGKIASVLKNKDVYKSVKVGVGGYSITFNDSIEIEKWLLLKSGKKINVSGKDLYSFVGDNIVETAKACEILGCSKQNLTYLIDKGRLKPIKPDLKENLFFRGDVEKNSW